MFKVEGIGYVHHGLYASIHHVAVRLIDPQGPGCHFGCVIDGNGMEMRIVAPIFVQDEQ